VSLVLCGVFFAALAYILGTHAWEIAAAHAQDTASLAEILFSRYVLPFEIAGLALTIALIGAIVLAREDDVAISADDGGEQR
jgi:NADH-quinone oxidoreductase subunit J